MVSAILSRLVVLTAGTLYPAYRSFKAVRTKDRKEYVKWMMYWIIFAFFSFFEAVTDFLFSFWFPFYYEVKIIFVLWLLSPWTKGSSIMYRKWVHPMLLKHEREIDHMLEKAKRDSYNQVVRFGSRGLLCAREVIASAALRGQAQLLQQIQRSYSTSDINREPLTMTNPMQNRNLQSQDPNDIDDDEMRIWDDELEQQQLPQREHPVETIREEAEEDVADASKMSSSRRTRASSKQRTSPIDPLTDTKYNTLPRRSARSQQNITT